VAGVLDAAEGHAGIGGDHPVDEDPAGFDFVDEPFSLTVVGGPGTGTEAETAVFGEVDGFVDIFDTGEESVPKNSSGS